ncbi:MAG: bi-domain-containing oxidoreductase [Nitrospirales bacterium]|nr:bi-domain-containing oxidoreductase [Nitrospirales bacterium]
MRQILQNLSSGETNLAEVPCPKTTANHLLIRTTRSLVSAGTERMLVEFGKANLLDKARQQPEKVRMVLDKAKTDGLMPTFDAVRNKLDQPLPMGYCNVGTVLEVGAGTTEFTVGDRVASNGKHAEIICVPKNLCAAIPDSVSDEAAAFTVIGAIGLQGIRLLKPTLGEAVVVTGLGLIGLMTVQLLRAHGCRVLGLDLDPSKLELARRLGAETVDLSQHADPLSAALAFSRGRGVDGVIITASTKSNDPVHQAALMCRKRGRIVLIGVTGLELSRADFYEKELTFQVSCSYGPGRYDSQYEENGQDYPFGLVRWTEQRNFEAVLDMLADGRLQVEPLVSHRIPFDQALTAYNLISSRSPSLGIILEYQTSGTLSLDRLLSRTVTLSEASSQHGHPTAPVVGCIGAGNYATQVLLPAFKSTGVTLESVVSSTGISAAHAGRKFGFCEATTDSRRVTGAPNLNTIVIATRHDSHAKFVREALNAGKHVFVEKPLAIVREDLAELVEVYKSVVAAQKEMAPLVMVGFNRRFAPQIQRVKQLLAGVTDPKVFVMTVNAGHIPTDHWTQDRSTGGGRIIGEGCHFVDLLRFLAGSTIISVQTRMLGNAPGLTAREDHMSFTLGFADGSIGTVHYLANGHKSFPKERLEVFCSGRILQLDNFRSLRGYGWPGFTKMNLWRQDKGQTACVAAFVDAIRKGEASPIPFDELCEVTRVTFDIVDAIGER